MSDLPQLSADKSKPPVVLLEGLANTLSLCRSFGRAGIDVTVCAVRGCPAHYSRFSKRSLFPLENESNADFWTRALIDSPNELILGSVLIACND